jgi:hypothetical protein
MGEQVENWRKASMSANGGEQCVEVGTTTGTVAVRDTVDRGGFLLSVPAAAWTAFTASLHA